MKIKGKIVQKKVKIGNLFNWVGIDNKENEQYTPDFKINVKTPYGYRKITNMFRTEKQKSVRTYFKNNTTLETSLHHLLKVNGEWKKIKDINEDDIIETENGITSIKKKHIGKEKILYDISVKDVHCYYSNGILSHNSWLLANIGLHALSLGKKVLHYTLELNESYVGLRYDAILTGIQSQDLKFHKDDVIKKVEQLKGDLTIKEYPTSTASIQTLYAHVKKHETLRFKPDIIIVDYGDLLTTKVLRGQDNSYHIGGNIFEELRGLAGTFRIPVWTASQAKRGAAESEIVEGHQIADSYKKVMISDFIMSLSRTVEDKVSGTGRVHIVKNRFGPDGLTYGSSVNAANGNFTIHDKATLTGRKETEKAFKKDGRKREYYRQKFNELNGGNEKENKTLENKDTEN